jgi:hypothetical protein
MAQMVIRENWSQLLRQVVQKPLGYLVSGDIRSKLPIRGIDTIERYEKSTHLEFVGRTLCGISPILERSFESSVGISADQLYLSLNKLTSVNSKSFLNFDSGTQPLVDSAFLALGLLRSPNKLWLEMPSETKSNILSALKSSKKIKPHFNNWLLFSAVIEAFFYSVGEDFDAMRIDYALRQHEQWYLGDGVYGDGPKYRFDYYNSYVIHPLLLEITDAVKGYNRDWDNIGARVLNRAQRHAEQLERLIASDGSFPAIGRSLAYRAGAFHLLALLALKKKLPESLPPAQVREALFAVIQSTLSHRSNYDSEGWLMIGLNGHQPRLGEDYISTGSLYLTTTAFLPLGLDETDEFWTGESMPWTQRKIWWLKQDMQADKARD